MFRVLKILEACVIVLIKVTSLPTLISSIVNGIGLGVIGFSNSPTWVLTTTTCISINFGKSKVQETLASSAPPLISASFAQTYKISTC